MEVVRAEEVNQKRTLETTVRTRADCVAAGLDGVLASEEVPESGVDLLRGWVLLVQIGTDEVLTLHLSQLSYSAAHLVRWTEDGNKIVSLDFPITCTIHDFLTLFNCLYGFEFDLLSLGSALRAVLITSFLSTDDDIFVGIRKIISLSNQTLHDADVVRLFLASTILPDFCTCLYTSLKTSVILSKDNIVIVLVSVAQAPEDNGGGRVRTADSHVILHGGPVIISALSTACVCFLRLRNFARITIL